MITFSLLLSFTLPITYLTIFLSYIPDSLGKAFFFIIFKGLLDKTFHLCLNHTPYSIWLKFAYLLFYLSLLQLFYNNHTIDHSNWLTKYHKKQSIIIVTNTKPVTYSNHLIAINPQQLIHNNQSIAINL